MRREQMFNWLFGNKKNQANKRNQAIDVLKTELKTEGFDVEYPPDISSTDYEVGAEIWVPMLEGANVRDLISNREKIHAVTEKIAAQFDLTAVGRGPVLIENTLYFICCGLPQEPLPQQNFYFFVWALPT